MELSGKRVQIKDILAAVVLSVLGYSDLSTAMIYTHIFDEEVETARRFFRRERIVAQEHNITMDLCRHCE